MKKLPLMITITSFLLTLNSGFTENEPMSSNNSQTKQFYIENIPVYSSVPRVISSRKERIVYADVRIQGLINHQMVPQVESGKSLKFQGYLPHNADATVVLSLKTGYGDVIFTESLRKLVSANTSTLAKNKGYYQYTVEITVIEGYVNIFIPELNKFERVYTYQIQHAGNFRRTQLPEVQSIPVTTREIPYGY